MAVTVYELTPANGGWNFAVLASPPCRYTGSVAKLAMDSSGNLYGTVASASTFEVFKLTHSGGNWTSDSIERRRRHRNDQRRRRGQQRDSLWHRSRNAYGDYPSGI